MGKPIEHKNIPTPVLNDEAGGELGVPSDASLVELRYTLQCAMKLSNETGLGMMSYLVSMACYELEDIMRLRSAEPTKLERI